MAKQITAKQISVQKFLDTEVADFASYSTVRAIASVVDGLKNAGRKVVYSTKHRPNKETKVSILAGEIMSTCLTYDTEINLEDGSTIKIGDWATKNSDKKIKLQSVDESGNKVIGLGHSPRETKKTNTLYCIQINGEEIRCTHDHKFLIKTKESLKWVKAEDLLEGDDVVNI